MFHEALRQAAPAASCVTRLQSTLTPRQMRNDAVVQWDEFALKLDTRYSARGAWSWATNWTVNTFAVLAVGIALIARLSGSPVERNFRILGAAGLAAIIATVVIQAALPVVPVALQSRRAIYGDTRDVPYLVRFAIQDELDTNRPISLESVRVAIQRGLPFHEADYSKSVLRALTFHIREEDSPYDYSLRESTNGVDLLLFDEIGRAEAIRLPE
jgi:hypothetical protein